MNADPTKTMVIGGLTNGEAELTISWLNGDVSSLLHFWLRDNCPQLRHATTKHRTVETSTIPTDMRPTSAVVNPDGAVEITWSHDGHVSTFTTEWLRANDYSNGARYVPDEPKLWDASIGTALPDASYPALCADDTVRLAFLDGFISYGVGVLRDVPCVPGTVLEVAGLLGEIRSTSWGTVFDVVSMEDANSLAYTNLPLVTHTDEGYRDPAPTVQLQHFLRADATGGASTLVDGFKVAEDIRLRAPKQFDLLANTMLDFHFADGTAEHSARGPIINVHPDGSIKAIRYSNHSVLPFRIAPELMAPFYEAYLAFATMRESDEYQLRLSMGAGDMYIVDNHRVLHGRTGFSSGGARHLQSCYIERDELVSRRTVLARTR